MCAVCALGGAGALAQPGAAPGAPDSDDALGATDIISVQDVARIEGQGETVLRGIGIVTGLRGTGDAGSELVLARPLAKVYASNGNPLPDLKDLAKAKSAAIVMLELVVPSKGARRDDTMDVHVTISHSATSLVGGRLFLSPLSGPLPGQGVYAMASGAIDIPNPEVPTAGIIRGGGRIIGDIEMPGVRDEFRLVLKPPFRHFSVADQVADTINALAPEPDELDPTGGAGAYAAMAAAESDVTVRVVIPEPERASPAKFIAKVLSATFSPSLLRLPAQVVINSRTGSIIVTGNVELSAVAIAHKGMVITTVTPPPVPTAANPISTSQNWTGLQTTGRASERARIQDLIQAFRQLDIPVQDQIGILADIHRTGRLHAELIIE